MVAFPWLVRMALAYPASIVAEQAVHLSNMGIFRAECESLIPQFSYVPGLDIECSYFVRLQALIQKRGGPSFRDAI